MKRRSSFLFSLVLLPALLIAGCSQDSAPSSEFVNAPPEMTPGTETPKKESDDRASSNAHADRAAATKPEAPADQKAPAAATVRTGGGRKLGQLGQLSARGNAATNTPKPMRRQARRGPGQGGKAKANNRTPAEGARDGLLKRDEAKPQNMYFRHWGVNPTIDTEEQPRSTFAVDVDTASYSMTRSYLERGQLPQEAAVRVEEIVNAFDYGYEAPQDGTFSVHAEAAPSPNRKGYHLLHVGVKSKEITKSERKDATLVFVIDVSGSMDSDNRLGLVKRSLKLLVNQLGENDKVGVVTYGSQAREVLQPTSAFHKQRIINVIDNLKIEGATNAEAGLRVGYAMAAKHLQQNRVTRVVLCSDGVANVGMTGENGLLATIRSKAKEGITISTVGFGMGNYNDTLMERLADGGNGNYHYVDKLDEARKVFVDELTGTLQVVAKDTKIQVVFNPKVVSRYRLIGYENRALTSEQFGDDRVDAGEVGAGHAVTAIYEIKLREGATGNLGKVRIRYKQPQGSESALVERQLPQSIVKSSADALSSPTQLSIAVAQFAEKLRGSYWARNVNYDDVLRRIDHLGAPLRNHNTVVELRRLVVKAKQVDTRQDKFQARSGPVALMSFDKVPVLR